VSVQGFDKGRDVEGVRILRGPDDSIALRISIGQALKPAAAELVGAPDSYLVFRGPYDQCLELLRRALAAFEEAGP
jgi:hypothetical protein